MPTSVAFRADDAAVPADDLGDESEGLDLQSHTSGEDPDDSEYPAFDQEQPCSQVTDVGAAEDMSSSQMAREFDD